MKEQKKVKTLAKKIIPKDHYKKAKKIQDPVERTEGLKYLVASKLKLKLLDLELKAKSIDKKEALLIESKLTQLKSKIKIFESTYDKRDYEVLNKIIQEAEHEIKCLTS